MRLLERLAQDLRYAARALARSPGFATVAIVTLALGIGANTAIFSVVHGVLQKPLPYHEPDRLVRLYTRFPSLDFHRFWISAPEYREVQRGLRTLPQLGVWSVAGTNLTPGGGDGAPLRVTSTYASRELFEVLAVRPALGRWFTAEEDVAHGPLSIVLSDGLWRRAFGARPDVVGTRIVADGVSATVVGVMPRGFAFPPGAADPSEAWLPLQLPRVPEGRAGHYLHVIGRLAPGATIQQAKADIAAYIQADKDRKEHCFKPENHDLVAYAFHDEVVREVRPALLMLLGAGASVLLIACVNVGNLLLARSEVRQREIALRAALGAGLRRLVLQFVTEGLLLSLAGAVLGVLVAYGGLRLLLGIHPGSVPRAEEIGIDRTVLLFTLAISVVAALLFALAPLGHARGARLAERLREGGQRVAGSAAGRRARRALVVGEIAATVILVAGAGLMVRSFAELRRVSTGFREQGLLTAMIELSGPAYETLESRLAFWERLLARTAELPGVRGATLMGGLLPVRELAAGDLDIEGYEPKKDEPAENVEHFQTAGPGFFDVLGIPIVSGRGFTAADRAPGAPLSLVVSQSMARKFWGARDPVGARARFADDAPWMTVVGVAADVKNSGIDKPSLPEAYFDAQQFMRADLDGGRSYWLAVRAGGDPRALAGPLRAVLRDLDPRVPLFRTRTMEEVVGGSLARPRFLAVLLSLFSGIALLMASIGIYGLVSYQVAQRRQEFGVRVALGAQRGSVLRLVLGGGLRLAALGIAAGVAGALALTRLIAGLFYGVSPNDPLTYAGVALLLLAVTLLASLVPAAAATRVDPLVALRAE